MLTLEVEWGYNIKKHKRFGSYMVKNVYRNPFGRIILVFVTIFVLVLFPLTKITFAAKKLGIEIESVVQNDAVIPLWEQCSGCGLVGNAEDNADYRNPYVVRYKITGLNVGTEYVYHVENGSGVNFVADSETKTITKEVPVSLYYSYTYIWASVTERRDPDNYAGVSASIYTTNPSFEPLELNILSIEQHNQEVVGELKDGDVHFNVNRYENVVVNLKAIKAIDDVVYNIGFDNSETIEKTGAYLKQGFSIIVSPKYMGGDDVCFQIWGDSSDNVLLKYKNDWAYNSKMLDMIDDGTVGHFSIIDASYENSSDKPLQDYYLSVKASIYNKDTNPISIKIKGENYSNETSYGVKIQYIKFTNTAASVVAEKNYNYTGQALNNGQDIVLEDLELDFLDKNNLLEDAHMYSVKVYIGDVEQEVGIEYGYGIFKSTILWGDGKQNAPGTKSAGVYSGGMSHFNANSYSANKNIEDKGYLYFTAQDYEEDEEYGYELYYGDGTGFEISKLYSNNEKIKSGTITGKELNSGKLGFKIENPNGYEWPSYIMLLTKNDKILAITANMLIIWEGAGLVSQEISTSQNVYLQMMDFEYKVPKESEVDMIFDGVGFDNNKQYNLEIKAIDTNDGGLYATIDTQNKHFMGKDLNDGKATITVTQPKNKERVFYIVSVTDGSDNEYTGSMFIIQYTDLNNLLVSNSGYRVDNAKVALRDVTKQTAASTFVSKMSVGAGTAKVFDKDGNSEVTGIVGTGMIARIFDEYGRPTDDLGIAVKGDITGDGDNTVLDVVKVSRHVAGLEQLDGIYEVAGDVTNTGSVTLLDLVKTARDVAGVEEL